VKAISKLPVATSGCGLPAAVSIAALVASAVFPANCMAQASGFPVFEALLYANMPDLRRSGVKPLRIAYQSDMWDAGDKREGVPSTAHIRKFVQEEAPGSQLVIDIEHWPLTGPAATVQESVGKYIETLRRFREAAPSWKLGFYSMVPHRDYWRAILLPNAPRYRQWQRENDAIRRIAEHVDILFPSLYTFYTDQRGWVRYAEANLREARRIAPGKPVYCFLWPQYHDSTRRAYQFMPVGYWKLQLQTCRRLADGIVIWGGVGKDGRMTGWLPWDDRAPWWKATVEFVSSTR
jgi:hypothetical protein